jgi:type VI secretion system secreted protein Hcp
MRQPITNEVRCKIRQSRGDNVVAVVLKLVDARGNQIKGESKVTGHVGEIDVLAWSWGVTVPVGARLDILDMTVVKSFDLASPIILEKIATNEILQLGVLTVIDQQGTDAVVVTLKKIQVGSVGIKEESKVYPPEETVALRFDEIELKYQGEDVVLGTVSNSRRRKAIARRKQ